DDPRLGQITRQTLCRAKIAGTLAQLTDDKTAQVDLAAFGIGRIDAIIADLRISHRDDLSAVRRIGQNLLVTGHARVEDDFTVDLTVGPECEPGKNLAIFEGQFRMTDHEPCTVFSRREGNETQRERRDSRV